MQSELTLNSEWNRCRWLWNEAVHQWRSQRKPTFSKLCKLLTEARAQNQWLREGAQNPQQQILRDYATSLNQSFSVKGRGRPKVKSRKRSLPSLQYSGNNFTLKDDRLCLAKCPPIPVVWSRELPSKPTSVRVFRDNLGHWYASFVVRVEDEPGPPTDAGIGIDWGVKTTATATDPSYDLPHHQHRRKCAAEVAKAQRKMSRRRRNAGKGPQTKGYKRAKLESAKLQKRAARQVKHDARVWARSVVNDHDLIAVEDFKPAFLAKSTMARKSADAAIGMTKRTLIEVGNRAGREVVMVKPAYTTMTCSECFARAKQRIELGERTFVCWSCGHTEDRDRNAARVILVVAERGHTSVDDVRHSMSPPSVDLILDAVRA